MFGNATAVVFLKNLNFFLLKFNMICTFWIVLMCWCQKWFFKNEKTSLTCILAWKVIWKASATTLPNTFSKKRTEVRDKPWWLFLLMGCNTGLSLIFNKIHYSKETHTNNLDRILKTEIWVCLNSRLSSYNSNFINIHL